jgi:glutamate formiminotransferase
VPNFSEGRDASTIEAIGAALAARARLLDVHTDPDHNRSVFTLVGHEGELVDALLAGVIAARERIDLRAHAGVHPRIGAADVVPIVPIDPGDLDRARGAALALGARLGALGLPIFLYAPPGRGPAFYRRGGPEELQRRLDAGELRPDFGPARLDPFAGAVIVGARAPLVALNVDLDGSLAAAKEIAAAVRESGGGFRGVRALGLELPIAGRVQVSMNIEDWRASPPSEVVARIRAEALARGVEVARLELVGLIPAAAAVGLEGIEPSGILESRLAGEPRRRGNAGQADPGDREGGDGEDRSRRRDREDRRDEEKPGRV